MSESSNIRDLLPERVRDVELYDPQRPTVQNDLSDNTNQWPLCEEVQAVFNGEAGVNFSRYPEIYGRTLKEKLVKAYASDVPNISTVNIAVGCGTDDIMDCIVRACTKEGDLIASPSPSFPMASYFGKFNDRKIKNVSLNDDGSIDLSTLDASAQLTYLCSPNNPTGLSIPCDNVQAVLDATTGFVVIDEAYAEFSDVNFLDLLNNSRVIIMRTFSKIYGLAGLRIGYAITDKSVIGAIEAVRGPYKANTLGLAAACVSLDNQEYYFQRIEEIKSVRAWFIGALIGMGFVPTQSDTNFVFIPGEFSPELKPRLAEKGFSVRVFLADDIYGVQGVRITLAPKEVLEEFLVAFKEALA